MAGRCWMPHGSLLGNSAGMEDLVPSTNKVKRARNTETSVYNLAGNPYPGSLQQSSALFADRGEDLQNPRKTCSVGFIHTVLKRRAWPKQSQPQQGCSVLTLLPPLPHQSASGDMFTCWRFKFRKPTGPKTGDKCLDSCRAISSPTKVTHPTNDPLLKAVNPMPLDSKTPSLRSSSAP